MNKITLPPFWIEYARKFREKYGIKPKEETHTGKKANSKEAPKKRTKPKRFKAEDIEIYVYEYYLKEFKNVRRFNSIQSAAKHYGFSESTVSRNSLHLSVTDKRYLFSRRLLQKEEVKQAFEEKLNKKIDI